MAPNNEMRGTQGTQDTSNPSNEVNVNSEYIDIMRKVPRILCERYELLDVLGKGAHGRIYLATDLVTQEKVAIKLVSIEYLFNCDLINFSFYRWRNQAKISPNFKGKFLL